LPDFEERYKLANDSVQLINAQDLEANASLMRGYFAKLSSRGRYAELERTLPQFNRWLAKRYFRYLDELGIRVKLEMPDDEAHRV
jgi:hypothetical protein